MPKSFKQDDVFPLIYRLITDRTSRSSEFICHSDLVDALLADAEGGPIVAVADAKSKFDTRGTAANMIAWFSQRFTIGANEFDALLERRKIGSNWAYRSKQSTPTAIAVPPNLIPDVDASAIEGNLKLVTHLQRERNPKLVKAKLSQATGKGGHIVCECCGFDSKISFPGIESSLVEVHHRKMLSEHKGPMEIGLDDLAVLCPTCHRAIHRSGKLSVEEFSLKYFARKKL